MSGNCYSAYDIDFLKQIAAEKLGCSIENVSYKISSLSLVNVFKENERELSNDSVHFFLDYSVDEGIITSDAYFHSRNEGSYILVLKNRGETNFPGVNYHEEVFRVGKFSPISGKIHLFVQDKSTKPKCVFSLRFLSFYAGF